MSTRPYVPGPCQIHVDTTGNGLEFLGWSVGDVEPRLQAGHEDVITDFSGQAPDDVQYFPQTAITSFTLVRFDAAVLNKVLAWINLGTAGSVGAYDVGTLLMAESKFFRVLYYAPYASAKAAVFPNMIGALNFPASYPIGEIAYPMSVRAQRIRIMLRHLIQWDHVVGNGVLYNSSTVGLPSPA